MAKEELIEMVTQLTKKVIDSKGKVISFQEEKSTKTKTKLCFGFGNLKNYAKINNGTFF